MKRFGNREPANLGGQCAPGNLRQLAGRRAGLGEGVAAELSGKRGRGKGGRDGFHRVPCSNHRRTTTLLEVYACRNRKAHSTARCNDIGS
jgi:hypothetical protein